MARLAGHNQTSFIGGVRSSGPQLRGFFESCLKLDNYNVDSSGYLTRRKGASFAEDIDPLHSTKILQIEPFAGTYVFRVQVANNPVAAILVGASLKPLVCTPYQQNIYDSSFNFLESKNLDIPNLPPQPLSDIKTLKVAGGFLWAVSSTHFAPFIIEQQEDNISVAPIYFTEVRDFLRSIPLNLEDEELATNTRLFIDKSTDLNTGTCRAWMGYSSDFPSKVNTDEVSLKKYLGKPLFFNVLPTVAAAIDKDTDYDADEDYTGTVLTGLNTLAGLADFETTAELRRRLITEFLFGRKYCIIPLTQENAEQASADYATVFKEVAAQGPQTEAEFEFEDLAADKLFTFDLPSDTELILRSYELSNAEAGLGTFKDTAESFTELGLRFSANNSMDTRATARASRSSWNTNLYISWEVSTDSLEFQASGIPRDVLKSGRLSLRFENDWEVDNFRNFDFSARRRIQNNWENTVEQTFTTQSFNQETLYEFLTSLTRGEARATGLSGLSLNNKEKAEVDVIAFELEFNEKPFVDKPDKVSIGDITFDINFTNDDKTLTMVNATYNQIDLVNSLFFGGLNTLPLVFTKNSQPVAFQLSGSQTGKRYFGWAKNEIADRLEVKFTDVLGDTITDPVKFKEGTLFDDLEYIGFGKDFSSDKYIFSLGFSKNKVVTSVNSVTLGTTTKSLSSLDETFENSVYLKTWELADSALYDIAAEQSTGDRETLKLVLTTLTPTFAKFEKSYVPSFGWSRGAFRYDTGDSQPTTIAQARGSAQFLGDTQGLLALGYQLFVDDTLKFTPFVLVKKTALIASETNCKMTIDGTVYTLAKFDVLNSDEVQAFRLADTDLLDAALANFKDSPQTISLVFGSTNYNFSFARAKEVGSTVYANCLIFELGAPSPVLNSTKTQRLLGGNNYDSAHVQVSRFVAGNLNEGFISAASVGSKDIWCGREGALHKFSRDKALKSNNIISRLTAPTAQEVKDTFLMSNVNIANLAAQSIGSSDSDISVLLKFLQIKTINLQNSRDFNSVVDYMTGDYLQAANRIFSAELIDIDGNKITPNFMQANSSASAVFVATNKGLFELNNQAFVPNLISRYVPKTNMISLNNKLVFVSETNKLISIFYSRERQGYLEELSGSHQQKYFKNVKNIFIILQKMLITFSVLQSILFLEQLI